MDPFTQDEQYSGPAAQQGGEAMDLDDPGFPAPGTGEEQVSRREQLEAGVWREARAHFEKQQEKYLGEHDAEVMQYEEKLDQMRAQRDEAQRKLQKMRKERGDLERAESRIQELEATGTTLQERNEGLKKKIRDLENDLNMVIGERDTTQDNLLASADRIQQLENDAKQLSSDRDVAMFEVAAMQPGADRLFELECLVGRYLDGRMDGRQAAELSVEDLDNRLNTMIREAAEANRLETGLDPALDDFPFGEYLIDSPPQGGRPLDEEMGDLGLEESSPQQEGDDQEDDNQEPDGQEGDNQEDDDREEDDQEPDDKEGDDQEGDCREEDDEDEDHDGNDDCSDEESEAHRQPIGRGRRRYRQQAPIRYNQGVRPLSPGGSTIYIADFNVEYARRRHSHPRHMSKAEDDTKIPDLRMWGPAVLYNSHWAGEWTQPSSQPQDEIPPFTLAETEPIAPADVELDLDIMEVAHTTPIAPPRPSLVQQVWSVAETVPEPSTQPERKPVPKFDMVGPVTVASIRPMRIPTLKPPKPSTTKPSKTQRTTGSVLTTWLTGMVTAFYFLVLMARSMKEHPLWAALLFFTEHFLGIQRYLMG